MLQSATILNALYPGEFRWKDLEAHVDDLLERFQNRELGDTIFRVGCDLYRKLGPDDRLAAPIRAAMKLNLPYELILEALKAGIAFRARDEYDNYHPSDLKFFEEAKKGSDHLIKNVSGLPFPV